MFTYYFVFFFLFPLLGVKMSATWEYLWSKRLWGVLFTDFRRVKCAHSIARYSTCDSESHSISTHYSVLFLYNYEFNYLRSFSV